jgi:cation diffusion facilitator family transporter
VQIFTIILGALGNAMTVQKDTGKKQMTEHRSTETGEIHRITWIGLIGNILISALKFIVGYIGSSQAIIADAVHSLSDMTTDIAILVGVKFWTSPADECHPYGHSRIEAIVTVGIGVVLALAAAGIGYKGISTVRDKDIIQPHWIAMAGAVISIITKEILYHWTLAVGKKLKSSALVANAWHHRSDALSSIPAALAVAIAALNPELSFVDHIGALIVSLFIIHTSWRIMRPALMELSDSGAPALTRKLIDRVGREIEDVEDIHAIRTRRMGSGIMVDLHLKVDGNMTVARGHDISEAVKKRIQEQVPDVLDVVVHLEPDTIDEPE